MDVKLNVYEGQLGLRKVWYQSRRLRPYLGAGGTVVSARAVVDTPDSRSRTRDVGFGGWVGGGLYVVVVKNVHVGVDARWGYANVTLNGNDTNAVGLQVHGLVGWYFGD